LGVIFAGASLVIGNGSVFGGGEPPNGQSAASDAVMTRQHRHDTMMRGMAYVPRVNGVLYAYCGLRAVENPERGAANTVTAICR
jgi:hypothetical protein